MNARLRDPVLSILAAVLLPLIFVGFQGLLARYSAASILLLRHAMNDRAAVDAVVYTFGIVGSALSAALLILPLGYLVTWRPWIVGMAVSMLAALQLAITSSNVTVNNYVEYASLIIFCGLAADVGGRVGAERKRKPRSPGLREGR